MSDELLKEAQEAFTAACDAERHNRKAAKDDVRFARLEEQWDERLKEQRRREGRPCLTINKLPPFIRQVVNDARQNKPQIRVQPQDSNADPHTAEVMAGLIRNIEASSDADVAYDTALEHAADRGTGYLRVNLKYACDDNWDQDIVIERVANPFNIYGDPESTAADSSDWNVAFVTESMPQKAFEKRFKGADPIDWDAANFPAGWLEGDHVMVAEYWTRREVKKPIVALSNGSIMLVSEFEERAQEMIAQGVVPVGSPRDVMSYEVKQHMLTGVEVLDTVKWAGRYIPIIPVYGEEVNLDGKRYFRSLIRGAKDAQVMYNAWRTASTELVALAPKAPFVGPKGAFITDQGKWETANTATHAFIEYDGGIAPQRQAFAGVPAGAIQEALNAADDMKGIIGIYDAGLGARSNETSGIAINARKLESDTSTFHFTDNLTRAIRHTGRILVDLIPKVYGEDRVIRVLGQEGEVDNVKLGKQEQVQQQQDRQAAAEAEAKEAGQPPPPMIEPRIYALDTGKYDVVVTAGPSFTTRREEAASQMVELMRALPAAAVVVGPQLAKNLDWPGADKIAEGLEALAPPQLRGENPEVQQLKAQASQMMQQGQQALGQAQQELAKTQQELQAEKAANALKAEELRIKGFEAETRRMEAAHKMQQPIGLPSNPAAGQVAN